MLTERTGIIQVVDPELRAMLEGLGPECETSLRELEAQGLIEVARGPARGEEPVGSIRWTLTAAETRAMKERARVARLTPYVFRGIDMKAELRRYAAHPSLREGLWAFGRCRVPKLTVRYSTAHPSKTCGHAYVSSRRAEITVTIGIEASQAAVLELLHHELVHCALPRREGHTARFQGTLVRTAQELFGIAPAIFVGWREATRGNHYKLGWDFIIPALASRLMFGDLAEVGVVETAPPPAPPAPPASERAAKRAAASLKREASLRASLERLDKKAKRMAAARARLVTKLAYYDRKKKVTDV